MDQVYEAMDSITPTQTTLCIQKLGLTTLDGIEKHPNFNLVTLVVCCNNQLTELPLWPNVRVIYCWNNKLTGLPLWPNVRRIFCYKPEMGESWEEFVKYHWNK